MPCSPYCDREFPLKAKDSMTFTKTLNLAMIMRLLQGVAL
jgi:hypothetical protein